MTIAAHDNPDQLTRPRPLLSRATSIYAAAGVTLTAAYFVFPAGSNAAHGAYELLALAALAVIAVGVRLYRPNNVGWSLIVLGIALWVAGDSYWNIYRFATGHEAPFPSPADALYLVCYMPLIAGILVFARGGRPKVTDLLEGAIVGAGATLVIWFAVVAPVAHAHTVSFGPRLIATAYPVADNLLMLALIQLVVARGFRPAALRYLVGAFALIFATDIVYARTRVSATFTPGSWLNAGYLLFYVLLGCAFLSPSIGQVLPLRPEPALTVSRIRLGSLVVPLLIAPILVAVGAGRDPVQARILAGGCALISLLVFARLVLVFKERDAFNRDRLEAHEELAQMAYRDPLTGLANRTALYDSVDCAVQEARATQRAVAILFLDLDRFKAVNDLYGHASGDEVLRDVASRLKVALRETDLVARHGGDEFVVAMPGLPIEQAPALAAAVTARIEAEFVLPFEIGEQRHQLGITSGFSVYPADGSTTAELVEAADRAMYTRKPLDVAVPAELGV